MPTFWGGVAQTFDPYKIANTALAGLQAQRDKQDKIDLMNLESQNKLAEQNAKNQEKQNAIQQGYNILAGRQILDNIRTAQQKGETPTDQYGKPLTPEQIKEYSDPSFSAKLDQMYVGLPSDVASRVDQSLKEPSGGFTFLPNVPYGFKADREGNITFTQPIQALVENQAYKKITEYPEDAGNGKVHQVIVYGDPLDPNKQTKVVMPDYKPVRGNTKEKVDPLTTEQGINEYSATYQALLDNQLDSLRKYKDLQRKFQMFQGHLMPLQLDQMHDLQTTINNGWEVVRTQIEGDVTPDQKKMMATLDNMFSKVGIPTDDPERISMSDASLRNKVFKQAEDYLMNGKDSKGNPIYTTKNHGLLSLLKTWLIAKYKIYNYNEGNQ